MPTHARRRFALITAACAVLANCLAVAQAQSVAPADASESASGKLSVKAAIDAAAYADTDHVYVLTPVLSGSVSKPTAGWSIGGQYLVDAVSAASVDIVSTASRHWQELRHAGGLNASYKPGERGGAVNASVSSEPDYLSISGGLSATQDLLDQNLTLSLGYQHGHDVAGRSGTPFDVFSRVLDRDSVKASCTVVLDRATLALFVLDSVFEHGDPSKPYRYVPLFAPGTQVPKGASVDEVNRARVSARPLEQLPLTRSRFALSFGVLHRFDAATLRVDERVYADSWALLATTTDARYLFDWGPFELGPHVRLHAQSAVSFWKRVYELRPALDLPALRTGDRELSPLLAGTLGWTLRWRLGPAGERDRYRLGLDINATETRYLDTLYITRRLSAYSNLSFEAQL